MSRGDERSESGRPQPAHDSTRGLCIAIDDVGLHAGIDEAALQLVAMQRVHALGCMVGGDTFARAAASLRGIDPGRLDIGLHLDLCERPLPPAPPRRLSRVIAAAYLHALDRRAVRAQIRAQLDAFEQALCRAPAFVDGHRHVHQLPIVRRELLDELLRRGGTPRPWLRNCAAERQGFKAQVIAALGSRGLARQAARGGFAQNRRLLGVYGFDGSAPGYRQRLAGWLREAAAGDLLMCHPSAPCDASDGILEARLVEFEVLRSEAFDALRRDAEVALAPMSAILRRAQAPRSGP